MLTFSPIEGADTATPAGPRARARELLLDQYEDCCRDRDAVPSPDVVRYIISGGPLHEVSLVGCDLGLVPALEALVATLLRLPLVAFDASDCGLTKPHLRCITETLMREHASLHTVALRGRNDVDPEIYRRLCAAVRHNETLTTVHVSSGPGCALVSDAKLLGLCRANVDAQAQDTAVVPAHRLSQVSPMAVTRPATGDAGPTSMPGDAPAEGAPTHEEAELDGEPLDPAAVPIHPGLPVTPADAFSAMVDVLRGTFASGAVSARYATFAFCTLGRLALRRPDAVRTVLETVPRLYSLFRDRMTVAQHGNAVPERAEEAGDGTPAAKAVAAVLTSAQPRLLAHGSLLASPTALYNICSAVVRVVAPGVQEAAAAAMLSGGPSVLDVPLPDDPWPLREARTAHVPTAAEMAVWAATPATLSDADAAHAAEDITAAACGLVTGLGTVAWESPLLPFGALPPLTLRGVLSGCVGTEADAIVRAQDEAIGHVEILRLLPASARASERAAIEAVTAIPQTALLHHPDAGAVNAVAVMLRLVGAGPDLHTLYDAVVKDNPSPRAGAAVRPTLARACLAGMAAMPFTEVGPLAAAPRLVVVWEPPRMHLPWPSWRPRPEGAEAPEEAEAADLWWAALEPAQALLHYQVHVRPGVPHATAAVIGLDWHSSWRATAVLPAPGTSVRVIPEVPPLGFDDTAATNSVPTAAVILQAAPPPGATLDPDRADGRIGFTVWVGSQLWWLPLWLVDRGMRRYGAFAIARPTPADVARLERQRQSAQAAAPAAAPALQDNFVSALRELVRDPGAAEAFVLLLARRLVAERAHATGAQQILDLANEGTSVAEGPQAAREVTVRRRMRWLLFEDTAEFNASAQTAAEAEIRALAQLRLVVAACVFHPTHVSAFDAIWTCAPHDPTALPAAAVLRAFEAYRRGDGVGALNSLWLGTETETTVRHDLLQLGSRFARVLFSRHADVVTLHPLVAPAPPPPDRPLSLRTLRNPLALRNAATNAPRLFAPLPQTTLLANTPNPGGLARLLSPHPTARGAPLTFPPAPDDEPMSPLDGAVPTLTLDPAVAVRCARFVLRFVLIRMQPPDEDDDDEPVSTAASVPVNLEVWRGDRPSDFHLATRRTVNSHPVLPLGSAVPPEEEFHNVDIDVDAHGAAYRLWRVRIVPLMITPHGRRCWEPTAAPVVAGLSVLYTPLASTLTCALPLAHHAWLVVQGGDTVLVDLARNPKDTPHSVLHAEQCSALAAAPISEVQCALLLPPPSRELLLFNAHGRVATVDRWGFQPRVPLHQPEDNFFLRYVPEPFRTYMDHALPLLPRGADATDPTSFELSTVYLLISGHLFCVFDFSTAAAIVTGRPLEELCGRHLFELDVDENYSGQTLSRRDDGRLFPFPEVELVLPLPAPLRAGRGSATNGTQLYFMFGARYIAWLLPPVEDIPEAAKSASTRAGALESVALTSTNLASHLAVSRLGGVGEVALPAGAASGKFVAPTLPARHSPLRPLAQLVNAAQLLAEGRAEAGGLSYDSEACRPTAVQSIVCAPARQRLAALSGDRTEDGVPSSLDSAVDAAVAVPASVLLDTTDDAADAVMDFGWQAHCSITVEFRHAVSLFAVELLADPVGTVWVVECTSLEGTATVAIATFRQTSAYVRCLLPPAPHSHTWRIVSEDTSASSVYRMIPHIRTPAASGALGPRLPLPWSWAEAAPAAAEPEAAGTLRWWTDWPEPSPIHGVRLKAAVLLEQDPPVSHVEIELYRGEAVVFTTSVLRGASVAAVADAGWPAVVATAGRVSVVLSDPLDNAAETLSVEWAVLPEAPAVTVGPRMPSLAAPSRLRVGVVPKAGTRGEADLPAAPFLVARATAVVTAPWIRLAALHRTVGTQRDGSAKYVTAEVVWPLAAPRDVALALAEPEAPDAVDRELSGGWRVLRGAVVAHLEVVEAVAAVVRPMAGFTPTSMCEVGCEVSGEAAGLVVLPDGVMPQQLLRGVACERARTIPSFAVHLAFPRVLGGVRLFLSGEVSAAEFDVSVLPAGESASWTRVQARVARDPSVLMWDCLDTVRGVELSHTGRRTEAGADPRFSVDHVDCITTDAAAVHPALRCASLQYGGRSVDVPLPRLRLPPRVGTSIVVGGPGTSPLWCVGVTVALPRTLHVTFEAGWSDDGVSYVAVRQVVANQPVQWDVVGAHRFWRLQVTSAGKAGEDAVPQFELDALLNHLHEAAVHWRHAPHTFHAVPLPMPRRSVRIKTNASVLSRPNHGGPINPYAAHAVDSAPTPVALGLRVPSDQSVTSLTLRYDFGPQPVPLVRLSMMNSAIVRPQSDVELAVQYSDDNVTYTTAALHTQQVRPQIPVQSTHWGWCGAHRYWQLAVGIYRDRGVWFADDIDGRRGAADTLLAVSNIVWFTLAPAAGIPQSHEALPPLPVEECAMPHVVDPIHVTPMPLTLGSIERGGADLDRALLLPQMFGKVPPLVTRSASALETALDDALPLVTNPQLYQGESGKDPTHPHAEFWAALWGDTELAMREAALFPMDEEEVLPTPMLRLGGSLGKPLRAHAAGSLVVVQYDWRHAIGGGVVPATNIAFSFTPPVQLEELRAVLADGHDPFFGTLLATVAEQEENPVALCYSTMNRPFTAHQEPVLAPSVGDGTFIELPWTGQLCRGATFVTEARVSNVMAAVGIPLFNHVLDSLWGPGVADSAVCLLSLRHPVGQPCVLTMDVSAADNGITSGGTDRELEWHVVTASFAMDHLDDDGNPVMSLALSGTGCSCLLGDTPLHLTMSLLETDTEVSGWDVTGHVPCGTSNLPLPFLALPQNLRASNVRLVARLDPRKPGHVLSTSVGGLLWFSATTSAPFAASMRGQVGQFQARCPAVRLTDLCRAVGPGTTAPPPPPGGLTNAAPQVEPVVQSPSLYDARLSDVSLSAAFHTQGPPASLTLAAELTVCNHTAEVVGVLSPEGLRAAGRVSSLAFMHGASAEDSAVVLTRAPKAAAMLRFSSTRVEPPFIRALSKQQWTLRVKEFAPTTSLTLTASSDDPKHAGATVRAQCRSVGPFVGPRTFWSVRWDVLGEGPLRIARDPPTQLTMPADVTVYGL